MDRLITTIMQPSRVIIIHVVSHIHPTKLPFGSGYNLIFFGGSLSRGSLTTSPITACGGKRAGDAIPEISDHILSCFA